MDIAALSIVSNQVQLKQEASLSVMKMVMDTSTEQTQAMLEMASGLSGEMELSVNPSLGRNINVSV